MTTRTAPSPTTYDSRFDRDTAMALAAEEYARFAGLLGGLSDDDWRAPTSCPGWTVRDMAGHTLGMAELGASLPEMARQLMAASRTAKRTGKPQIDALTELQVRKHQDLANDELVAAMERIGPRAVAGRRRRPGLMRGQVITDSGPDGTTPERWRVGYLIDTVLTRDPWMHRSDIAHALGRPMQLTAEHDGVFVADVVEDWAVRHGQPYELTLTGPAGGHWSAGVGGEQFTLDAEEFCRVVSGRGAADHGLLTTFVPF
ncbi:hypothetical protein GCM10011584_30180 [Nocardioides phosphati]|uniref:Mycothiol-dependent maleylpyruvate isomerase metal-binding domain-containing protein n=1 Tax=Nocardioides phosphati TaxID=1867775 RepID=A0ABQ2NCK9_9ACTN|nr:maleylpyruvate isomerase family mycothiol-dependent enzyme [Nocardioides phosphati]GGO92841.1 hypothetical protein GCM10011584_30180 [Nocardioides phosphati]